MVLILYFERIGGCQNVLYNQNIFFLFAIACDPNITVNKVIWFNRFYLAFRGQLIGSLKDQLNDLLHRISNITLTNHFDKIIWRWKNSGLFSVHLFYSWLNFGDIKSDLFKHTWQAPIPLKIIFFYGQFKIIFFN